MQKINFPESILFACSHNMIRSPMAEALMKSMFPDTIFADSCGLKAGCADGFVNMVMDELNIDTSQHRPKNFDDLEDESFDIIICFSEESFVRAKEFSAEKSMEVEYWPVFDAGLVSDSRDKRLAAYRLVRDTIKEKLEERFSEAFKALNAEKA